MRLCKKKLELGLKIMNRSVKLHYVGSMINLAVRFEDTRVYKDTYAKGVLNIVLRLLPECCGHLKVELIQEVTALPVDQLETLGCALLNFEKVEDLEKWLEENTSASTEV